MLKKSLCAAALALISAGASAQTHWDFAYYGFYHKELEFFDPSYAITGSFDGVDIDGDGVLQRNEITGFKLDGLEYVDKPSGCETTACELLSFSYGTQTGKLDFTSFSEYKDDFNYSYLYVEAGLSSKRISANNSGGLLESTYLWTDQTEFAIFPAPVPEPSMIALLTAGLLTAGVYGRRQRRNG